MALQISAQKHQFKQISLSYLQPAQSEGGTETARDLIRTTLHCTRQIRVSSFGTSHNIGATRDLQNNIIPRGQDSTLGSLIATTASQFLSKRRPQQTFQKKSQALKYSPPEVDIKV